MASKKQNKKNTTNHKKTVSKTGSSSLKKNILTRRSLVQISLVILLGVSVFLLAKKYRNLILVGSVNNMPVSRWQLSTILMDRYGKSAFEELANEMVLKDLAKKESISVSADDIKTEQKKLVDRLGGEKNLELAIQQYGLTKTDLQKRLELSLIQKKITDKLFQVEVTDAEVKDYFEKNSTSFPDQKLEDIKDKIKQNLIIQKKQENFTKWFDQKKKEARINTYL